MLCFNEDVEKMATVPKQMSNSCVLDFEDFCQ